MLPAGWAQRALPCRSVPAEMRVEPWQTGGVAEPVTEAKLPRERKPKPQQ